MLCCYGYENLNIKEIEREGIMLDSHEDTQEIRDLKRKYGLNESLPIEQDLKVKNVLQAFKTNAIKPSEVTTIMHNVLNLHLPINECKANAERLEV